ncbi:hypothetical protein AVEN_143693-1 [Araneus ventricosus]|uniref:Tc1-like transposase DDE domain-containing protein n=1 Tax=Araneus ventricosus TaxID=182803 RepID=A0A4Y2AND3_ARAVE|nr:hypothetical protein AVEN_143693-1 [Araneus ventricosus]
MCSTRVVSSRDNSCFLSNLVFNERSAKDNDDEKADEIEQKVQPTRPHRDRLEEKYALPPDVNPIKHVWDALKRRTASSSSYPPPPQPFSILKML